MEKIPISIKGKNFEIQVTEAKVGFFLVKSHNEFVSLGNANYIISHDGEIIQFQSGGFTIGPKYLGLGKTDIARLERVLLGEAERAIYRRNPKIQRVIGQLFDVRRKIGIPAGRLFKPAPRRGQEPARIRLGKGQRLRKPRAP